MTYLSKKSIDFFYQLEKAYPPLDLSKMNYPTNAVKIVDLSKMYSKKDIKRELKAAGLGRVDFIVFEEPSYNGANSHSAYVWFRPTRKSCVIAKRCELTRKLLETTFRMTSIQVRCAETPRTEYNEDWCLTENKALRPEDDVGDSVNELPDRMTALENTVDQLKSDLTCHRNIIYQLLGGLFNQDTQPATLDHYVNVLFNNQSKPKDYTEESNWPTTRQGDLLEEEVERINERLSWKIRDNEKLEREVVELKKKLSATETSMKDKFSLLEDRFNSLTRASGHCDSRYDATYELDDSDEE